MVFRIPGFRRQEPAQAPASEQRTFWDYVRTSRIPYYSRADHLKTDPAPADTGITDEHDLMHWLDNGEYSGIIINGVEGVGKTRLMLQLADLARDEGWDLVHVGPELPAVDPAPGRRILLLMDYADARHNFTDLIESADWLSEGNDALVRYVATCPTCYYAMVGGGLPDHKQVQLLPYTSSANWNQHERYLQAAVEHILLSSGIVTGQKHTAFCKGLPVLAMLLSYLRDTERNTDLADLLDEGDFGRWLTNRLQASLGAEDIIGDLAVLLALLPLPQSSLSRIADERMQRLLNALADDGWIALVGGDAPDEDAVWELGHEVLADQVVLAYLHGHPGSLDAFAQRLLDMAMDAGDLAPALSALQRIAPDAAPGRFDWYAALRERISSHRVDGGGVSCSILYNAPLTPEQQSHVLKENPRLWTDMERWLESHGTEVCARHVYQSWLAAGGEPDFVQEPFLGWLEEHSTHKGAVAMYSAWLDAGGNQDIVWPGIEEWVEQRGYRPDADRILSAWLSSGGDRDLVEGYIERWIRLHGERSTAVYVIQAWIRAEGDQGLVDDVVKSWIKRYPAHLDASLIYSSCLDAGWQKSVFRDAIAEWMAVHYDMPSARFVYRSWIEAGGELEFVKPWMTKWLEKHGAKSEAGFLYSAWLNADGDFAVVREPAGEWLHGHKDAFNSNVVIRCFCARGDLPISIIRDILEWIRTFAENEDAFWRFTRLRMQLYDERIAEEVCSAAEALLRTHMARRDLSAGTREHIIMTLSWIIRAPGSRWEELRPRVDALFLEWLRHPESFGTEPQPDPWLQHSQIVHRFAYLIGSGALDPEQDADAMRRFVQWLNLWEMSKRLRVAQTVSFLARTYPIPGVWSSPRVYEPPIEGLPFPDEVPPSPKIGRRAGDEG